MSKLILIGCGGVGGTLLELFTLYSFPIIDKLLEQPVVVIEPKPVLSVLRYIGKKIKVSHRQVALTQDNVEQEIRKVARKGDFIVDLSVRVDAIAIIRICQELSVLYLNTSMEIWSLDDPDVFDTRPEMLYKRSLQSQQLELHDLRPGKTTAIIDAGMNPGLITHLVKCGLESLAGKSFTSRQQYVDFAKEIGLRVIHCSEVDTQLSKLPEDPTTFRNTWSADGFLAEGQDSVQLGLGTHEGKAGEDFPAELVHTTQLLLPIRGMDLVMQSYVPGYGRIEGLAIPHGEAFSLSQFLSDGDYGPSVYYVYQASKEARESMDRSRKLGYKELPKEYVFKGVDIVSGYDAVGALMMSESRPTVWCGSILDIEQTRKMGFKYGGPTTVQVASGLMATMTWALLNPQRGICTPEDLPSCKILAMARPFLGNLMCTTVKDYPDRSQNSLRFPDFILGRLDQ